MALRWAIGCRSRKLRWGNVCLHDWTVPRVHVNWAPCNHPQAHIWSVCLQLCTGKKKAGGDYPRSWMFHFETVIEMDFCLPSFTLWQTPKSQSSKFSVKVLKWFMNRGCMARGTAGGWVWHFPLKWNIVERRFPSESVLSTDAAPQHLRSLRWLIIGFNWQTSIIVK